MLQAAADFGVAVDCVVLDYQMPGMTGADVARIIRSTPAIADTPIVMLTSVDQSLSNSTYRDLGIEAQLIKPARSSALLETLVPTIQKHRHAGGGNVSPGSPCRAPASANQRRRHAAGRAMRTYSADGHRVDILVAEDNEVNQLVFTQILADTPYSFEIVGNGRRAVEAFSERNPRMILMDVSMPEMNGIEATAAIRGLEAARVIACADRRRDRACAEGRPRALPRCGHGRLSAQADQSQGAAGQGRQMDALRSRAATQRGIAGISTAAVVAFCSIVHNRPSRRGCS